MFLFQLFSEITPPDTNIPDAGSPTANVIMLLNFILRVIFFVAGLWALWNFISAGFQMIGSSGDPKKLEEVQGKFIWTFIGIAVMVFSIVVAGIIGIILNGKWDTIINPDFSQPL